jgi:hypothetical protein
MKTIASIAFLCLLAASCSAANHGEQENKKAALRRLDNGEHVRSVVSFIFKLMYAGTQQLSSLRSAAPTTAPLTAEDVEPAAVQERAPNEPKHKKAANENELQSAGEVVKKAKKTKAPTSAMPSDVPSYAPSFLPSDAPSFLPSDSPSVAPSIEPTGNIQGFIRCEAIYACNSGSILGADNDGFWMSKLNRDGVTCETTCTLPVSIAPRKVLGWTCGSKCAE